MLLSEALNVYSMLGLFMLLGVVKKNGILQVDYTNTLRARGMDARRGDPRGQPGPAPSDPDDHGHADPRHAADRARTRPGRRGRAASIARVIVGGQALSLLITLLITPVAYSLFDDLGRVWLPALIARGRALLGISSTPARP